MGKRTANSGNSVFANTLKLISKKSLSLFLGQGILLFVFSFILTPLISNVYYGTLKATGYSYVTVDNIRSFLLKPLTVLIMIVLLLILGIFLMYEIFFLITYFAAQESNKKIRFYRTYGQALHQMLRCIKRSGIRLIPTIWLTFAVFNLPLFGLALFRIRLFKFLTSEIKGMTLGVISGTTFIGLLCWLLFRKAFIFHYSLADGQSYTDIRQNSRNIRRNRPFRTLLYFIPWNILCLLVIFLVYALAMAVITLFTSGIPNRTLAIATFISVNDSMNGYLLLIAFIICTVGNFALLTHLFYKYGLASDAELPYERQQEEALPSGKSDGSRYRKILRYSVLVLILINLYFYFNILRNGSPLDYMNLDTIQITSHRGYSHDVPENTIPAIEKAMEEKVDYVEVDVRATKDGELVLLHDPGLKRTTGLNRFIWDIDYSEVALLDAGLWLNKSFQGTKIPTLREVFELCKGKVVLNLDLKYRNPGEGLAEKTVDLIKEYDMGWQCVISSSSLACLEKVKELDPDLQTGYVIHQLYSGLSTNETIDFFSMNSSLVSKNVVQEIHKNGKKLYVWTVNSRTETERLKRLGVDNIITDDPAFTREALEQADSDQYFLTLLKVMRE